MWSRRPRRCGRRHPRRCGRPGRPTRCGRRRPRRYGRPTRCGCSTPRTTPARGSRRPERCRPRRCDRRRHPRRYGRRCRPTRCAAPRRRGSSVIVSPQTMWSPHTMCWPHDERASGDLRERIEGAVEPRLVHRHGRVDRPRQLHRADRVDAARALHEFSGNAGVGRRRRYRQRRVLQHGLDGVRRQNRVVALVHAGWLRSPAPRRRWPRAAAMLVPLSLRYGATSARSRGFW